MKRREREQVEAGGGKELSPTAIAGIVLLALIAGLAAAGWWAWGMVSHVEEFGQASDSFGYLESAADIRAGHAPGGGEKFTADSENARAVIAALKVRGVAVEKWESAVGPAAYHYDARSGKVINQYPPGVGRMLAVFPAGRALEAWYLIVFAMVGVAAVGSAVWGFVAVKRRGSLAGLVPVVLVFLGLHAALNVLGTTASYSVDLFVVAGLPAVGLIWLAAKAKGWVRVVSLVLAGAAAGYVVYMRVAGVLFLPGIAAVLWMGMRRAQVVPVPSPASDKEGLPVRAPAPLGAALMVLAAWGVGVVLVGVLPLMVHQAALTGSAVGSTYARADTALPEVGVVGANAGYYFAGDGSLLNWALWVGVVVFAAGAAAMGKGRGVWGRVAAVAVMVGLPTIYFLTHPITTPYYQFPTVEMGVLAMAAAAVGLGGKFPISGFQFPEGKVRRAKREDPEGTFARMRQGIFEQLMAGAVLLGVAVHVAVAMIPPKNIFAEGGGAARTLALPAEVEEKGAWVLADRYSGTLWLTHGVYALNMTKADAVTRGVMWEVIRESGRKVYVVDDRPVPEIKAGEHVLVKEARALGGKVEGVGEFEGAKVWRVGW